jgi:hypothetical protein
LKLSNLNIKVTEEQVKEFFKNFISHIEFIALAKQNKFLGKGYALVKFTSKGY